VHASEEEEVLQSRQAEVEGAIAGRDEGHAVPQKIRVTSDVATENVDRTGCWMDETGKKA
jgi:hypothetical protein